MYKESKPPKLQMNSKVDSISTKKVDSSKDDDTCRSSSDLCRNLLKLANLDYF